MRSPGWFDDFPENVIARRLANALEAARSPVGPCLTVETDAGVVLWRLPRFTFRLHAVHRTVLELEQLIRVTLPVADLVAG